MISKDGYLYFVDEALDGMAEILNRLGDDLANRRPELPGANSPYAILTHCLGVMGYWAGHLVAGREVQRDRDSEFVASGGVSDLLQRLRTARDDFGKDVAAAEPEQPLRGTPPPGWSSDEGPYMKRQGEALMHVYEELAQHRGQMELSRDLLSTSRQRPGWSHEEDRHT